MSAPAIAIAGRDKSIFGMRAYTSFSWQLWLGIVISIIGHVLLLSVILQRTPIATTKIPSALVPQANALHIALVTRIPPASVEQTAAAQLPAIPAALPPSPQRTAIQQAPELSPAPLNSLAPPASPAPPVEQSIYFYAPHEVDVVAQPSNGFDFSDRPPVLSFETIAVQLDIFIDALGIVRNVVVVQSNSSPEFNHYLTQVIQRTLFMPAQLNHLAVNSQKRIQMVILPSDLNPA